MSDLLEARQTALVVVAAGPVGDAIATHLTHAGSKVVTDSIWAELEA
jgi:hypothetical protein